MRAQLVPRHGNRTKVQLLEAELVRHCPLPITIVQKPDRSPDVLLVMYGPGSIERSTMLREHVALGGRAICFDRGYFGRSAVPHQEHYRVAIDQLHVSPKHIEATPDNESRIDRFKLVMRNDTTEQGPVIVAGLGEKSCVGLGLPDWDIHTLRAMQRRFPKRRVIYRPKTKAGVRRRVRWPWTNRIDPIDQVLKGASLCVVRHSNVAVDACVAGIPVECEDGAALWLYQSGSYQTPERRATFLRKLAWWNWRVDEMAGAWKFFLPQLV